MPDLLAPHVLAPRQIGTHLGVEVAGGLIRDEYVGLVHVRPGDGHPARVAARMHQQTGHEIEYEVLHGDKPSRSIVDFAERNDATFVFATTHGRTGLDRLRLGSVAAEVVRHAPCPVVLYRPPHLAA